MKDWIRSPKDQEQDKNVYSGALLLNFVLEVLASAIRQEKKRRRKGMEDMFLVAHDTISILPKLVHRFNEMQITTPISFLIETDKPTASHMET